LLLRPLPLREPDEFFFDLLLRLLDFERERLFVLAIISHLLIKNFR